MWDKCAALYVALQIEGQMSLYVEPSITKRIAEDTKWDECEHLSLYMWSYI